jgi:hypothetical protein
MTQAQRVRTTEGQRDFEIITAVNVMLRKGGSTHQFDPSRYSVDEVKKIVDISVSVLHHDIKVMEEVSQFLADEHPRSPV